MIQHAASVAPIGFEGRSKASLAQPSRGRLIWGKSLIVLASALAGSGAVHADEGLSKYGMTLYGVVDVGVSYQTHGNPFNADLPTNVDAMITKFNNKSNFSMASNGLSFSTIGLKGRVDLIDGVYGLFKVETSFQPASGTIANGVGSLADNNGLSPDQYSSLGDSNKAGQALNGNAYVGLESSRYGKLTLGRNSTLLNDAVCKYDALSCAPSFSYVGYFGSAAGIGDTETRFLDRTLKYTYAYHSIHGGALYQFPGLQGGDGSAVGNAYQFNLGTEFHGFSADAVVAHKQDGIFIGSPLSAAQVASLTNPSSPYFGLPVNSTLPGIVSDNFGYGLFFSYDAGRPKFYAAYEHVDQKNPGSPLPIGTSSIGGYRIIPINSAFPNTKTAQFVWGGVKYALTPAWTISGAYYHVWQNSYGLTSCSDVSSGQCSGQYDTASAVFDYKFPKYVDLYSGVAWSQASNGMANGYFFRANVSPMLGARFGF